MFKSRAETALSAFFAVMALTTAFWPDWLETVFRVDPDGGNGAVEWLAVVLLGAAAVVMFALARRDRRTARSGRELAADGAGLPKGDYGV